jgi:hypothetical protein
LSALDRKSFVPPPPPSFLTFNDILSNRYINAETSGGGFPGWLTNFKDAARSNGTDFTAAWKPYIREVSKFTAPYQYPAGPVILVQSENEFSMDDPSVSILAWQLDQNLYGSPAAVRTGTRTATRII